MVKTNKQKFNEKYNQPKNQSNSKKDISKLTGIPMSILDEVYDRGLGAHRSNPESVRSISGKKVGGKSLKGKMTAPQWAMARVKKLISRGRSGTFDRDIILRASKRKRRRK